jgi:hypothetical protein
MEYRKAYLGCARISGQAKGFYAMPAFAARKVAGVD